MVENYNMSRDVLLLHLPNRIHEMGHCFKGAIPMVSLNVVSVIFPHFSPSMLTTMVMCHNFMLEKHFYYTISMFQLIRVFMCRESATSCDFYRRRQVDVFVLNNR